MTASAEPELRSEITCPHCGHRKVEKMPTDACQFIYECEGCRVLLRPKKGDCCVSALTARCRARPSNLSVRATVMVAAAVEFFKRMLVFPKWL
jgi:hypothetical protein